MLDQDQPITFDRFIRIAFTIFVIIGIFVLVNYLSSALLPFFVAALLAYLIYPIVTFFQYKLRLKNRVLAIFATLISLTIIFSSIWAILAPTISSEASKFVVLANEYAGQLSLPSIIPDNIQEKIQALLQSREVHELAKGENMKEALGYVWEGFSRTFSGIFGLLGGLVTIVVILLYLVFILMDYEDIGSDWKALIPPKYRSSVLMLADDLQDGMEAYFRAQTKIVIAVCILFAVGFKLIGLPLGIALGIFVGLLNYVPYLQNAGFIPAFLLGVLYSMESGLNFWLVMGLILLVFTIVQLLQDAIITPRVMGNLTGLDPAIILLSLSIWGTLLGILGMIIALPMTTLILSYYKRFIVRQEKKYNGVNE